MKFIAFYGSEDKKDRFYSLSGNSIISYLYDTLIRLGIDVVIVSPSWYIIPHMFTKESNCFDKSGRRVVYCPSIGLPGKVGYIVKIFLSWIWLIRYLIKNTKSGEKLLVYHTTNLMMPLLIVKRIKKLKYITYFGELFQDVYDINVFERKLENKFLDISDDYIFATQNQRKRISKNKKYEFLELYGCYENRMQTADRCIKENDKKIIVYSGKLDAHKGVINLIRASEKLSVNYEIHILGYGEKESIKELKKEINNMRKKGAKCKCFYDGSVSRAELDQFLSSCYIGVCLQNTNTRYNSYAFPSKIITYLANGVPVLCSKIDVVQESAVSECIEFCDAESPEEVALKIREADWDKKKKRAKAVVGELNESFCRDLKRLLEEKE